MNAYKINVPRGSDYDGCTLIVVATSEERALESLKETYPWLHSEKNTVQLAKEGSIYFPDDRC